MRANRAHGQGSPMQSSGQKLPVIVVAPFGKDAELICSALQRASLSCEVYPDARSALPRLSDHAGALVLEEEAVNDEVIRDFSQILQQQPPWSDAPVVLLTRAASGVRRRTKLMAGMWQPLARTVLLERPVRPETLVSTVETVIRARHRQFQVRDAMEQLQASEARYRSLILATASIVWTTDLHGNIIERLPSWEAYTGQSFQEYRGRRWVNAIHQEDRAAAVSAISEALAGLRPFQLEFRLLRHDGQHRCVLARGVPVFRSDSTVKEWVETCTDIQDRKDSERALRRSERMAMAGQLAAAIAHEINNPLQAVTSLVYLMRTRANNEELRRFATQAQEELARITEISAQTLGMYRKSTNPMMTDVAELLSALVQLFKATFDKNNIRVRSELVRGTAILAFPNELKQLFANLISNAIDATPSGGEVRIMARPATQYRESGPKGVRVVVADTGSGIEEGIKRHIFEPFVTSKGETGTGLGLWICDDIVKRHGGTLKLKSKVGARSGSVFSI